MNTLNTAIQSSLDNKLPVFTPVITPFVKNIHGINLIMWDYSSRAYMYEQFVTMSDDMALYSPVKFEKL